MLFDKGDKGGKERVWGIHVRYYSKFDDFHPEVCGTVINSLAIDKIKYLIKVVDSHAMRIGIWCQNRILCRAEGSTPSLRPSTDRLLV